MTTPLTKYYESTIQDGPVGDDEIIALITTDRLDRDREVIVPSGINLDEYNKNRVVMYGHAKGTPQEGAAGKPVGKALWIRPSSDGRGLCARIKFDMKRAFAAETCGQIKDGFLNAFSITFLPIEFGPPTEAEIKKRPDWKGAKTIYRRSVLLEPSVVVFPANVDATVIAKNARKPMNEEIVDANQAAETALGLESVPDLQDSAVPAPVTASPVVTAHPDAAGEAAASKSVKRKDDDEGGEEAMSFKPGDHVKCKAPHFKGYGKCMSVHKDGMVPDVEEDLMGTKEEPACRVKCYKAMDGGFVPTKIHKAMLCKHAEPCGELKAPEEKKKALAEAEAAEPGWSEAEKSLYIASRLESADFARLIEQKVADLVDTQVLGRV